jgi:hypothetical protein
MVRHWRLRRMKITLGHVVLALGGVLVVSLVLRYLKIVIHVVVLFSKVAVLALAVFVVVYVTGIWRPDLSPLLWLISKLWGILGTSG